MAENKTAGAQVSLADVGKLGTAYVTSSTQALKLASAMLDGHEKSHKAAVSKVAAVRELLAKTKLIEPGEEKQADEALSSHDSALDVLANVLTAQLEKDAEAEKTAATEPQGIGRGVDRVGASSATNGQEKAGRMVMHERRPRGASPADLHLRDTLLRQ